MSLRIDLQEDATVRATSTLPGRGTPLMGQRECSVDFGTRCDQREFILRQFARLADRNRSDVVAGVQGRIRFGYDPNRKNYLFTSLDAFSETGFLKSIVILSRPKAALSYDTPTGRLAG